MVILKQRDRGSLTAVGPPFPDRGHFQYPANVDGGGEARSLSGS